MRTDDICPQDRPPPDAPPPALEHHHVKRMEAAIAAAWRRYPEPVAAFLDIEIRTWADFGWRIDRSGRTARLVDHLLSPPGAGQ